MKEENQEYYFKKTNIAYPSLLDHEIVKWESKHRQYIRFALLSDMKEDFMQASICDYGCGVGSFYDFLCQNDFQGTYTGYDFLEDMITHAKKRYPSGSFTHQFPQTMFDYIIASGVFNIANHDFMQKEMTHMIQHARKGIAVNFLSVYSKKKHANEHYVDPLDVINFCKKYTDRIYYRHDYFSYEFTLYIYLQ